ncbi:MAG: hypothetical protein IPO08_23090 [Xanthomonadales bacterium]|nr:hypothetical protein [Xanthomonadales bacterium]
MTQNTLKQLTESTGASLCLPTVSLAQGMSHTPHFATDIRERFRAVIAARNAESRAALKVVTVQKQLVKRSK